MPIPTDTFWNVRRLNWVFAISSIALLGVMAWSVLQDYDKTWRQYQRSARVLEAAMVEEKLELPPEVRQQVEELSRQIAEREAALAKVESSQLDPLRADVRKRESDIAVRQSRFNDLKANTGVDEAAYQDAVAGGDAERAAALARKLEGPRKQLAEDTEVLGAWKADVSRVKEELAAATKDYDELAKQRKRLLEDQAALAKKHAALEPQDWKSKLSSHVRATPLLQFVNPADRIVQQDLTEIRLDLGGQKQVNTIDRCMTCHVNAHRKDFTEEKVLAFLERQLAVQRLPDDARRSDPWTRPDGPGAAAMPEFWHAWGVRLLPRAAYEQKAGDRPSLDALLNGVVASAGKYAKPPVGAVLLAKVRAAVDAPALLAAADREQRDQAAAPLMSQLYADLPAMQDAAAKAGDEEARAALAKARDLAVQYPARVREAIVARLSAEAVRLVDDRYRRALVAEVNVGRASAGRSKLDDSRALLAHPNLDLYVDVDSKHSYEQVGCTSCHDGSGQETNFILAAHTPRDIWVDQKSGAPVHPVQLLGDGSEATHDETATLSNMLESVYPAHDLVPSRVDVLHLDLAHGSHGPSAPTAKGEAANGAARGSSSGHTPAPHPDPSNVNTAPNPEHAHPGAFPRDYVDPVTGRTGQAVPQRTFWERAYEHEAGRSLKLVHHEWDWPMRPPQYLQANCVRCHNNVSDIREHAPVVHEGRTLFNNLGCVNCHQMDSIPAAERRRVGPDLGHVTSKLSPSFISAWVWAPKAFRPSTRMPHFFLLENNSSDEEIRRTRQEARAITEYLVRTAAPLPPKHVVPAGAKGNPDEGRKTFRAVGCMACHTNLNLPAVDLENAGQEIEGVSVGQQWIVLDLVKKGELSERLRPRVAQEVATKLEAGLGDKVRAELTAAAERTIKDKITEELTPKEADGSPKKRLTREERSALNKKVDAELKKRRDAEQANIDAEVKSKYDAALAEARKALPGAVVEVTASALAEATAAEAKRVFEGMSYNERQVYVLENLEAPPVIGAAPGRPPELPRYADGTPKPIFVHHGPELSGVGTKLLDGRSPEQARAWLYDWLKEPKHYGSYTLMPDLRLSDQQALDLTEHLLAQRRDAVPTKRVEPIAGSDSHVATVVADDWASALPEPDSLKLQELTAFFLRSRYSPDKAMAVADDAADIEALAADALRTGAETDAKSLDAAKARVRRIADEASAAGRNPKDELRLLYLGKKLIGHYGCMSCHQINGAESLTSPCANLSDWGQKQVGKLDYAYLDPHKVHAGPPPVRVPMVNGLSAAATRLLRGEPAANGLPLPRPAETRPADAQPVAALAAAVLPAKTQPAAAAEPPSARRFEFGPATSPTTLWDDIGPSTAPTTLPATSSQTPTVDVASTDTRPAETRPALGTISPATAPADVASADARPAETQPALATTSPATAPVDAAVAETRPAETQPALATTLPTTAPADVALADTRPATEPSQAPTAAAPAAAYDLRSRDVTVGWPEVAHTREAWLTQKLLNTRIWDRGKVLQDPKPERNAQGHLVDPGRPYDKLRMPTFYLNEREAHAIVTFVLSNRDRLIGDKLLAKANSDRAKQIAYGRYLTQKHNCVGCHQVDRNAPAIQQHFVKTDLATKAPPTLRGEGNKVVHDWLSRFLWNPEPLRPLMQPSGGIRMPTFHFDDDGREVTAIAAYFASLSNKEADELKRLLEPVQNYQEQQARDAALRAARITTQPSTAPAQPPRGSVAVASAQRGLPSGAVAQADNATAPPASQAPGDPATQPTGPPQGVPPPSSGYAVAEAVPAEPARPDTGGPRPKPEAAVIPAAGAPGAAWFRQSGLASSAERLRAWALETRQMEPFQFDPARNPNPADLENNYAALLFKARFTAGLYNAPYPFPLDRGRGGPMPEDAFKRGEQLFTAMACTQCHTLAPVSAEDGLPPAAGVVAPNLAHAHRRIQGRWFRHWVQETDVVQRGTPMPPFFTGLAALKVDGLSWPRAVPPKGENAEQLTRWVEHVYGPTADTQVAAVMDFVYEAGRRGYRVDRPATGIPPFVVPDIGLPPLPETRPSTTGPDAAKGEATPAPATQPAAPPVPAVPAPAPPADAPPAPAPVAAGDVAVSGTVTFVGTPPKMAPIAAVKGVPQCQHGGHVVTDETVVVDSGGGLKNVAIWVSSGLAGPVPVPKQPVVLDQKGCQYTPHVVTMTVGQELVAKNSDNFLHNVHSLPEKNEVSNFAQPGIDPGSKLKPVKVAETFKVKCDVHPWMGAWVVAVDSPFHTVSRADGSFDLAGVPPGTYTLTAWHEALGTRTAQVTVKAGEPADVELEFGKK